MKRSPIFCFMLLDISPTGIKALEEADKITDGLGRALDPELREVVAAFILLGLETYNSCAGHRNRGGHFPFIDFRGISWAEEERVLELLPRFHFVDKGIYGDRSLCPGELPRIDWLKDHKWDYSWDYFAPHRRELQEFASDILQ